jgi:hypothetical protein
MRIAEFKGKKAMATYLVIVLIAFVALSLSNVTILNRGEMGQIVKSEALIKADLAARALYQKFSWRLKCLTYDNRPCKDSAYSELFEFEGVKCELLCYDSEDESESLDIWVLAKSEAASRAVFYRVKYQQSLVNSYNKITPSYSAYYNIDEFPSNKTSPKTPQKILDILKNMRENLKNKSSIVKSLENTNNINQILQKLNGPNDPTILNQIPKTTDGQQRMVNVAPPNQQNSDLLTLNALKKTDNSMLLANATSIAGNSNIIDAPPPEDNPPAASVGANQPAQNGANLGQGGGQGGGSGAPPNKPAPYSQRVAAWAKAGLANLAFGFKRFFGTANDEDRDKANSATKDYLAVSKPNSISASIAKKYNEVINNNYSKK